jgi:hypothetical protein
MISTLFNLFTSEVENAVQTTTYKRRKNKSVHFAPSSCIYAFRYPTREENNAKWYSREDEATFRRQRWQDVAMISTEIEHRVRMDENEPLAKDIIIN